jgi:hypothetical protein
MVRKVQTLRPRSMTGAVILKSQRSLIFYLNFGLERRGVGNVAVNEAIQSCIPGGSQAWRHPLYHHQLFVPISLDGVLS